MPSHAVAQFDETRAIYAPVIQTLESKIAALRERNDLLEQNQARFVALNACAHRGLYCQSCTVYLVGKIYMCSNGHNFCEECHLAIVQCSICLVEGPRGNNVVLEAIATNVMHPCSYMDEGCTMFFSNEDWEAQLTHETDCLHKLKCRFLVRIHENVELPCLWRGKVVDYLAHCQRNHADDVVLGVNEFNFQITFPKNVKASYSFSTFVMLTSDAELFMIRFLYHYDRKLLVPHAFYLGTDGDLDQFKIWYRFANNAETLYSNTPLNGLQYVSVPSLLSNMPHLDQNALTAFSVNDVIQCSVSIQRV